jgi:hypothetical protein
MGAGVYEMSAKTRDIVALLRERVVPPGGGRHGLVIGIEQYRDERLNLRCATADAKVIFDLMIDPDCGMFPKDNVRLLLNEEATREGVWRALSSLRRSAGENDTVWVYYAGHAAPEESNLYWVTHDADVDDLYGTGLSNDQISKVLNDIRSKRLVVLLDCCHAAATATQKNPTRAVLTAEEVFACYKGHGRITLSSSDGKEKSVELGDVGHGAFTYFLEKGLRGEADADGDGVVTADELWKYLRAKVVDASQRVGNAQTPVLIGEMRHDFALSLNPISVGRKRKLVDLVTSLIGLGADRLSTEEAEVCVEIIKRPPRTPQEESLVQELHKSLGREPNISLLKVLIESVKGAMSGVKLPCDQKQPPPATETKPKPSDLRKMEKSGDFRKHAILIGGGSLLVSLVVGILSLLVFSGGDRYSSGGNWREEMEERDRIRTRNEEASRAKLAEADAAWDRDDKPAAVRAYKEFLNDSSEKGGIFSDRIAVEKTRVYRRVIEHELKYGDSGDARDWMVKALGAYYVSDHISMDSPQGKALLEDVRRGIRPRRSGGSAWSH